MTREEVTQHIRESPNTNFLLILSTGFGKTKAALEILNKIEKFRFPILIVVPRIVLIENWKKEILKFGFEDHLDFITFTTYQSLHKHSGKNYGYVIYDECHHLSERCKALALGVRSVYNCFLSATVKQDLEYWIKRYYENLEIIKVDLRKAIDNDVLPEPKVYLIPLQLNDTFFTETLIRESKNKKKWAACFYSDRWKYLKDYNVKIKCTEQQYYNEISNDIEYWKKMYMGNTFFKNKWLHLCGTRLKWLSDKKTEIILNLLKHLKNYRTLTFCNSIEQTELLGKYCINSKNKLSGEYLNMFNNKKIKHITSVNMLNEGCNLTDCRIGIFASINSSEILIKQKNGRILRHKNPIIIIPYYINTREEELVKQMLENYNPELVSTITNFEDIVL